MAERMPVRVRRVLGDVLYDSETDEVIHYWDEKFLIAEVRSVLGKTPDGRHFMVSITEDSTFRSDRGIDVTPFDRLSSIALLADVEAPEPALEALGVKIVTPTVCMESGESAESDSVGSLEWHPCLPGAIATVGDK